MNPCAECLNLPCETCSGILVSVFDIATQKVSHRSVWVSSINLNEMINEAKTNDIKKISISLKKRGLYIPEYLIKSVKGVSLQEWEPGLVKSGEQLPLFDLAGIA